MNACSRTHKGNRHAVRDSRISGLNSLFDLAKCGNFGDYPAGCGIFPGAADSRGGMAGATRVGSRGTPCAVAIVMARFFRRFIGALVLDAGAYEDIESDRSAGMQSVLVVLAVCLAGGIAVLGLGYGIAGFASGAIIALGAWLVWAGAIVTLGTGPMAGPQTRSDIRELLRVLGYAAAPGVFVALAAMRAAAPVVLTMVSVWMIAAAVIAVRQALDYRSTGRAVAVCAVSWLVAAGMVVAVATLFTRTVS